MKPLRKLVSRWVTLKGVDGAKIGTNLRQQNSLLNTTVLKKCFTSDVKREPNLTDMNEFIEKETEVSTKHLTPEVKLHLITPRCRLWHSGEEECPLVDPFWAFYWPGGQALTRYLLDTPSLVRGKRVLDVGSGCGASAIAAALCRAEKVTANDICPAAAHAIQKNAVLNQVSIEVTTDNYIGNTEYPDSDVVLLGDMFYDAKFAESVASWLELLQSRGKSMYIGDPGRVAFSEVTSLRRCLKPVASYELPEQCKEENHGLTRGYVWMYCKPES